MEDLIIEYDKNKTKILKYIMYKKRTEKEIIQKFSNAIEKDMLEDIIEELKENGYINDKLYSKGISSDIIETYFSSIIEQLEEYELQSAKNIILKKQQTMSEDEIRIFLRKKGYNQDTIKQAFSDD